MYIPPELAHPLVFNSIVLAASFYILFKSADYIVDAISGYAKRLGLSEAIIGLVVVAMAASAPEIISSLTGFLTGQESVGFGAILGANMVHVGFALGLLCLVGGKVALEENIFTKQRLLMWIALMLPFVLALDGSLTRSDGIVLLGAFVAYLIILWRIEGTFGKIKKTVKIRHIWKNALIFLLAFVALILAGRWLVFSSVQLAVYFNIPVYFIALTVIGIGTTLPDIAVEVKAVRKAHPSVGLGDLLGSLVIELLLFFGLVALLKPFTVNVLQVLNALLFLAGLITVVMFLMKRAYLTRKHGLLFMGVFVVFLAIEIFKIAG